MEVQIDIEKILMTLDRESHKTWEASRGIT